MILAQTTNALPDNTGYVAAAYLVFFALILMHLAAGLFHALIRRDGVFDAMGPRLTHDEIAPAE